MLGRVVPFVVGFALLALVAGGAARVTGAAPTTVVQLRKGAAPLAADGARLVVPALRLWTVPRGSAVLRERRADIAFAEPERYYGVAAAQEDPLAASEWWRAHVGIDALTPPGPGVPITIVDTGVSLGHPEFRGRPDLVPLNNQEPAPLGGVHGTAVTSVAGAAENGVGVVGIYPRALLRIYDVSLGDGTRLPSSEIAAGIVAAAHAGRSVINLSLGGADQNLSIAAAVDEAVRTGSLVVAASGNSGDEGNWISYPGASRHVLTVGATDRSDAVADFSTRSPWVDVAAPGVEIPVATALDNGFAAQSGTSFAAPIVTGAAAWVWTLRPQLTADQLAEILRRSARDVGPPGFDHGAGYGIVDVRAALAEPTPVRDAGEPNDDPEQATPLASRAVGRVAAYDDPRDVFAVRLPARKRITISATSDNGVALSLAGVAQGIRRGATTTVVLRNTRGARPAALVVTPARGVRTADYRLTISSR